jgi:hypothetical protein
LLEILEAESAGQPLQIEADRLSGKPKLNPLNKYLKQKKREPQSKKDEEKYDYFKKQSSSLKLSAQKLRGLALHYYLENIKYNSEEEKLSARRLLKSKYGNLLGKEKINTVIEKAEEFIIANPEIFSEKHQVFNEYLLKEKIEAGEKHYRIDRLLVDREEKKIKIIDYKSGSYRNPEQLEKYKQLLAAELRSEWEIRASFVDI